MASHLIFTRLQAVAMIRKRPVKRSKVFAFLMCGLLLAGGPSLRAQTVSDTAKILTPEELVSLVIQYHPLLRAAALDVESAGANLTLSRGAFDPQLAGGYVEKVLNGTQYYRYFTPQLSIPTWYGLEFKAGVDDAAGQYLNPETTPGPVSYAGVKLLASSIIFDQRRAVLQQAKILLRQSQSDRILASNQVLYDALSAYWNWWQSYQVLRIYEAAQLVAVSRFDFVKSEYEGGARAAIDTTEALAQLQGIEVQTLSAQNEVQNTGLLLSTFLWSPGNRPFQWLGNIVPPAALQLPPLQALPPAEAFLRNLEEHPKLQSAGFKIESLRLDQRLKTQYLLPKVSLYGNVLGKGTNPLPGASRDYFQNNFKVGFDVSIPLFLREARGGLRMARIKTEQAVLSQDLTRVELAAKIQSSYNEVLNLNAQLRLWEASLEAQERLTSGEMIRFEVGESTLFLVNARQSKLLETAQKLRETRAKLGKAEAALYNAAALLLPADVR
jgi:outer membrane protein TolC